MNTLNAHVQARKVLSNGIRISDVNEMLVLANEFQSIKPFTMPVLENVDYEEYMTEVYENLLDYFIEVYDLDSTAATRIDNFQFSTEKVLA